MCLLGRGGGQVVKWSACSSSTPKIRVRILLKLKVFSLEFVLKKYKKIQKEAGDGHVLRFAHVVYYSRMFIVIILTLCNQ